MEHVQKRFKDEVVIKDLSLEVHDGELLVLIGPSGCGKTTTLKMMNRLLPLSGGHIYVDGEDIAALDPVKLRRNMGYVIQQGGLFPHMTVRQNIEIIEKLEKRPKDEMTARTRSLMAMIGLDPEEYLDRYPAELSGGQQQRVGVARALATDPEYVLFDEPFSALDPPTRMALQDEVISLHEKLNKTMIFVTHDMDEAIKIADRICLMKDGEIVQLDTSENILRHPANAFVSEFVGSGRIWSAPEFIRAQDIMIDHPVKCRGDLTVEGCIIRLQEYRVSSLMVVDKAGRLIGVVDKSVLIKRPKPDAQADAVMRPVRFSVHPEDQLIDIVKAIPAEDVGRINDIPVVDSENRLVGLVTNNNIVSKFIRPWLADTEADEEGRVTADD